MISKGRTGRSTDPCAHAVRALEVSNLEEAEHTAEIDTFRTRREAAFTAERKRWAQ
jgi:hypothetical protein